MVDSEEEVLNALFRWLNFSRIDRRQYLGKLFKHVRLMLIPRGKLLSYMFKEDILKEDTECYDLYKSTVDIAFRRGGGFDANEVDALKRTPEDLPSRLYVFSGRQLTETVKVLNFAVSC